MRIKTTDAVKTFLVEYPEMLEIINTNNYYDAETNITYTNGIRSIYKYCKKYNYKFRNVVLDLFFEEAFIPKTYNPATEGLEVI